MKKQSKLELFEIMENLGRGSLKDFELLIPKLPCISLKILTSGYLMRGNLKDFEFSQSLSLDKHEIFENYEPFKGPLSRIPVSLQVMSDEDSFWSLDNSDILNSPESEFEEADFPSLAVSAALTKLRTSPPSKDKWNYVPGFIREMLGGDVKAKSRPGQGGSETASGKGGPYKSSRGGAASSGADKKAGGTSGASRGGGGGGNKGKRGSSDPDGAKPKRTFAEMTKDLKVIEVRADDPKYPLKQEDFDCLEFKMLHEYLDIEAPNFVYSTPRSGISQGAVWYGCQNQGTYDFIKNTAPETDPPEDKPYRYIIAAGDKRYIKIKCPKKFWMARDRFMMALHRQNPTLARVRDTNGQWKDAHMVITSGLEPEGKAKALQDGYFTVGIEIEETSIPAFVALRGEVVVGNSSLRVTGAGIDATIEEADRQLADEVADIDG